MIRGTPTLFLRALQFRVPSFVSEIDYMRYSAFSNLMSLITALIIGSLVISAYLSHYLPSEQPWRAGGECLFHISSARSCLIDTLSRYRSLDSGGLSLYLSYYEIKRDERGTPARALWWNRGNQADAKGQDGDISYDLRRPWIAREINSWPDPIDVLIQFLLPSVFVHWVFVARPWASMCGIYGSRSAGAVVVARQRNRNG